LPESGVLNYTTVNIPVGRTLKFAKNSRNTSVYMLSQGGVAIAGTIDVSANRVVDCPAGPPFPQTVPGPGGFYGGSLGSPGIGFGPGGGTSGSPSGRWVGPLSLVPLIGGSGAASRDSGAFGAVQGGSGGGAIVIASSTSIVVSGSVVARGGLFGNLCCPSSFCGGASGSGGAIRIVANSINVSGVLDACGQFSNCGVIHLEAPTGSLTFTGSSTPPAGLFIINPSITDSSIPSLTI